MIVQYLLSGPTTECALVVLARLLLWTHRCLFVLLNMQVETQVKTPSSSVPYLSVVVPFAVTSKPDNDLETRQIAAAAVGADALCTASRESDVRTSGNRY